MFGYWMSLAGSYWPLVEAYAIWAPVVIVALVVAWYVPPLRSLALMIAASIVAGIVFFQMGDNIGSDRVQKQWDIKLQQEAIDGEKARSDAVGTIANDTPYSVRNDPWNRDRWKR